ncbi:AraC family transcriptional regulator [Polyangium fumosum]|uniref:AraC family transcriptional regulator n=1 Tax=Polyangium fumosum TaxID=889272 RepID=A0A4U1JB83_9BACT|nr:AraC family transcriptional regulator [Polyangium fumosum]TKD05167.1 AraC family transcriptional regulator [Polyangium fumosum]
MGRHTIAEEGLAGAAPSQREPREGVRSLRAPEVTSTVHAGALRHMASVLEGAGLDPRPLLVEAGVGEIELVDPDQRVAMARYVALWRIAAPRFPRGSLGLAFGAVFELDHGNLLTYMTAHAATLGDAVLQADRYRHLIHEMLLPTLDLEGGDARLRRVLHPSIGRIGAMAESIAATWVKSFSIYIGEDYRPREVWFQHAAPRDLRPYDEAFRCPVRFEMPETRMIVDREELERPLRLANPRLRAYLEEQARSQIESLPHDHGLAARVRRLLVEELRGGAPSQDHIARRLALSPRTLQRRLKDEGVVFNDLLDEQRRALCDRYLQDRSLSIQEIAFLLGYTERSSFYRAFRRWTGRTPQELRKSDGDEVGRDP